MLPWERSHGNSVDIGWKLSGNRQVGRGFRGAGRAICPIGTSEFPAARIDERAKFRRGARRYCTRGGRVEMGCGARRYFTRGGCEVCRV